MWRDAWGFHVFSEHFSGTKARFAMVTLSPDTGELVAERSYDVIPSTVGLSFAGLSDMAEDGQGHFAVTIAWRNGFEDKTSTLLLFGSVDSDAFSVVENPAGLDFPPQTVSWVGDGFLVELYPSFGSSSHLYKYSIDGQLLGPPKIIPTSMTIDWYVGGKSVEPTTHEIWMAHGTYPSPTVWGFHPDASPFPQPTPSTFFVVDRSPCLDSSGIGMSVAPTPTNALLSWEADGKLCLQEVGLDLQTSHPALPLAVPQKPFGPFFYWRSTAQRWGDQWWVAAQEQRALRSIWVKDWKEVSNEPLITHAPAKCLEDKSCEWDSLLFLDVRMLTPIVWEDELWLGYKNAGPIPKSRQDAFRFVRVAPGCVYPSFEEADL